MDIRARARDDATDAAGCIVTLVILIGCLAVMSLLGGFMVWWAWGWVSAAYGQPPMPFTVAVAFAWLLSLVSRSGGTGKKGGAA